jgi:hypothetical protein
MEIIIALCLIVLCIIALWRSIKRYSAEFDAMTEEERYQDWVDRIW